MIRSVIILFVLIWSGVIVAQDDLADIMTQANGAYEDGDYLTAIMLYEELIDSGVHDATVFFNLGNAYYEVGQLGHSLLNYRRAQLSNPRDVDISTNIALVRAERVNLQHGESGWIAGFGMSTRNILTLSELSWIVFTIWVLWFGLVTTWIMRQDWRKRLRWSLVITGVCLVLGLSFLTSRLYVMHNHPGAVVTVASAQLMSGPGEDYLPIFALFAAAEIRILESRDGWVRIVSPNGRQGWINNSSITPIRH